MIKIDNDLRHSAIKFTNIKVGEIFADGLEFFIKLSLESYDKEKLIEKFYHDHYFSLETMCGLLPRAIENLDIYNVINLNTGEILAFDTTFENDVIYMTPVYSKTTNKKVKFKNIEIGDAFIYNNIVFIKGAKYHYSTFRTRYGGIDSQRYQDIIFKKGVEIKTGKVIDFEESTLVSPVNVKFERMLVTDFYK